jgi:3,4-dihydroxy 2-butanone 4-phosphate synthase/GTP cyclohydrolase II
MICEKGKIGVSSHKEGTSVKRIASAALPTEFGRFRIIGYRSRRSGEEFIVLTLGAVAGPEPVLVRIHSQCMTGDVFGSVKCDCGRQLHEAQKAIAGEGRGIIVYQQQEGRGIGIMNKIRAYNLQDAGADTVEANVRLGLPVDTRRYEQCGEILIDLGVEKVRLISNNPEKIAALKAVGLEVTERVTAAVEFNNNFAGYLRTKHEKMGHFISPAQETQWNREATRCADFQRSKTAE